MKNYIDIDFYIGWLKDVFQWVKNIFWFTNWRIKPYLLQYYALNLLNKQKYL